MKTIELSWEAFKNWVGSHCTDDICQWCFRGQKRDKYKLRTTFHRKVADSKEGMSFSTYFQSWVLGRARQYISSIMDRDIGLESDEELFSFLALLQHHGFPTPMLDWTKSPYIAAYFAFRDAPYVRRRGHKVAVYAFDYSMIVSYDGRIDCDKINFKEETVKYVEIVKPISAANPRLIPQQSICMLTNIDDIENWICKEEKGMPCDNDEGTYLIKFLALHENLWVYSGGIGRSPKA